MLSTRQIQDREESGIMEHCAAVTWYKNFNKRTHDSARYARSQSRPGMKGYGRPLRDMMAEYEAVLAATSLNMIDITATPWS